MKSPSKIQQHPNQEDKSGHPTYASPTGVNYSTNDPRLGDEYDGSFQKEKKTKYIRVRPRKHQKTQK